MGMVHASPLTHGFQVVTQIRDVQAKCGIADLAKLLHAGDTWEVRP